MTGPAYPAARYVAAKLQPYFARRLAAVQQQGQDNVAFPVDAEMMEAMISAAFWASLRREEGYIPKISIAFLSPKQAGWPLRFENPLPLTPNALTHLASAVERPGIHLGVWHEHGELCVWGATHALPALCFVLEVVAPGLLVIKHSPGEEDGKFVNVAVLEGDEIKILDQQSGYLPGGPTLLTTLLGCHLPDRSTDPVDVLIQLAVSMRAHGRGGSLLVVPSESLAWQESIVQPILYSVCPPFSELATLLQSASQDRQRRSWQEALRRGIDAVAGLTAIDGATVITDRYELLAFGAKISRRDGSPQVERITLTEPVEGTAPLTLHPSQLGGTRHLSAAQFAHDQRDALALVASQDGHFTLFDWSPCDEMVHAHRVEALLL